MRQQTSLVAVALFFGIAVAHAQNPPKTWDQEPTQFKGIGFNATLAEAGAKLNFETCFAVPDVTPAAMAGKTLDQIMKNKAGTRCKMDLPAGTNQLYLQVDFGRTDHVKKVEVKYKPFLWDSVRNALIGWYGSPTSDTTSVISNEAGGHYEQEDLVWIGKNVILAAERYGETTQYGRYYFVKIAGVSAKADKQDADIQNAVH